MKGEKRFSVGFSCVAPADAGACDAAGVRRKDGELEVVGAPAYEATLAEGDTLIGTDQRGRRRYYFVHRGGREVAVAGYREEGAFTAIDDGSLLEAAEVRGMAVAGDMVAVATADGISLIHYSDGAYASLGERVEMPVFAFGVTDGATISARLPATQLGGSYSDWSGPLSAADASALRRQFSAALEEVVEEARRQAVAVGPVVARVGLRLWDDSLLWSDEAAIVGECQMPSALATATAGGSGTWTVEAAALTVRAWKPTLTVASAGIGAWRRLVKAVEVYTATPRQLSTGVSLRMEESQQGTPAYYLRLSALTPAADRQLHELAQTKELRLSAVVSDIDSLVDAAELSGGGVTATGAEGAYAIDVATDGTTERWESSLPPFSPAVIAAAGGYVMAGDATFRLPEPPHYMSLADGGSLTDGVCSTFVSVEIATEAGKAVVARAELGERYSTLLNPFVSYPDSRARRLRVSVTAGGATRAVEIELSPSPSGDCAYAVSDGGFRLAEATLDVPAAQGGTWREAGTVVTTAGGNLLQWRRCPKAQSPGVTAIAPSFRYGSSWLLGRSPVCLFSTDGLRLLSFGTDGTCTAATLISRRTVATQRLVTATAAGLAFVDTHGELCRYEGTKVAATGIVDAEAKWIGYSVGHDEIWIGGGADTIAVDAGNAYSRRLTAADTMLGELQTAGNVVSTVEEETARQMEVELRGKQVAIEGMRLKEVVWDVMADYAALSLTVYGENGRSCHGERLSALRVSGAVGAPIVHRLVAPWTRSFRLGVAGTLPSGARIGPAAVRCATGGGSLAWLGL